MANTAIFSGGFFVSSNINVEFVGQNTTLYTVPSDSWAIVNIWLRRSAASTQTSVYLDNASLTLAEYLIKITASGTENYITGTTNTGHQQAMIKDLYMGPGDKIITFSPGAASTFQVTGVEFAN